MVKPRQRKPVEAIRPVHGLRLVPAPARTVESILGVDRAQVDELKALIRSINEKGRKSGAADGPGDDDDRLPPAA